MTEELSQIRKRTFGSTLSSMKMPYKRCFFPGGDCDNEPIRAHSVQNAKMMELLQIDGHVIAPRLNLSFKDAPSCTFEPIGRNQATTFHGLCSTHDTEIFTPIENSPLDLNNEEHLFLLAYRAVLKEAHATAKSARDTQTGYQAGIETGLFPTEPCAPGMLAVNHIVMAYMTHDYKERFDRIYKLHCWDGLGHYVRDLAVQPSIAVNAMISTGRYSKHTNFPAYAILNVFPYNGTTMLLFSYLAIQRKQFNRSFKRFISSGDALKKLSYLILKRCENFVISPAIFVEFTTEQKNECQRFYERNIGEYAYETQNQDLIYLFGAVK